jgi:hypothetical protein
MPWGIWGFLVILIARIVIQAHIPITSNVMLSKTVERSVHGAESALGSISIKPRHSKTWEGRIDVSYVFKDVKKERKRQDEKWGQQDHDPCGWISIITEELGEAAEGANRVVLEPVYHKDSGPTWLPKLRKELIEVAACAVAAIESLDRNELARLRSVLPQDKPLVKPIFEEEVKTRYLASDNPDV